MVKKYYVFLPFLGGGGGDNINDQNLYKHVCQRDIIRA